MIPEIRKHFNTLYTDEKYRNMLHFIESTYPGTLEFRIAETPVFFSKELTQQLIEASEKMVDVITKL